MAYWLFKSEPDAWSWDDQVKAGKAGTEWTGVRNFTARNNMRAMKKGDHGFFYHSGDEQADRRHRRGGEGSPPRLERRPNGNASTSPRSSRCRSR